MKLASLKHGRDGRLVVVDADLRHCVPAGGIAATLQDALDDWARLAPRLRDLAARLEAHQAKETTAFEPSACAAPLPRAYQWVDGSAYVNHVELVRKARGAELPASFWTDPLVYQGGSDDFLGPTDDAPFASEEFGIDLEAEVAVVVGDVPMGSSADAVRARGDIRLVMLVNDWSLRNLIPGELGKGFGFYQSKPATAFSPVAVTPDELGDDWRDSKLHLPVRTRLNGAAFGAPDAGVDMTFDFAQLIAHCARTRNLAAGTIVGSGTVSNYDRSKGSACIAERRMLEQLESGSARTPFLKYGDQVRIEVLDRQGRSVFGAIEQRVVRPWR
ncbi:MAG TPA: fumarylacetoacetate hydrolase family protein [Steroidobacteraceae bacterium]|nr:fumarylacetoacetate hydrolase family protein [Steroidobacteraceae bacterium]